jgi:Fuc2NAc and GlcNAc transferase
MQAALLLAPVGCLLAWQLTGWACRYALASELLDRPNARSSHTQPTPRGGGVAIVASFLLLTIGLGATGRVEPALTIALVGGGLLVAGLGYADDRKPLPARWRFLGHVVAAAWVLSWLGPVPAMPMLGRVVDLGWAGPVLCMLFMVWMINLFNFMDGIDGIASVEAMTVCLGGSLLWWLAGFGAGAGLALLFAACVAGFLLWNFPPARIFMGDAGSGFLGLVVALLAMWCGQATPALFWSWFILVGCFMVDATTTLLRRVRRGEKFHEAHRSHAYQYASRRHRGHRPVTLACAAINLLWLLPVATLVALGLLDGVLGIAVAYAPLVWLAYHYKAGARELQRY